MSETRKPTEPSEGVERARKVIRQHEGHYYLSADGTEWHFSEKKLADCLAAYAAAENRELGGRIAQLYHRVDRAEQQNRELRERLAETEKWLHYIVLNECDPREAVKGNLPSPGKAVETIIDKAHCAERAESQLRELAEAARRAKQLAEGKPGNYKDIYDALAAVLEKRGQDGKA